MNAAPPCPAHLSPLLIRASAGSGKTYQLSNRFLALLCDGVEPDEILATTFTRKAAGEILDRVLQRLADAAAKDKDRRALEQALGRERLTRDDCRDLLVKTVRTLHRLRIGTLDSFFIQVAGSYALEFGLPPGWSIGEEIDDRRLRESAVNRVLNDGKPEYLRTLFHLLTKGEAKRAIAGLVHDTVRGNYNLFLEASPEAWDRLPAGQRLNDEELGRLLAAIEAEIPTAVNGLQETIRKDLIAVPEGDWPAVISRGITTKLLKGDELTYRGKPFPPRLVELYEQLVDHIRGEELGRIAAQTVATRDLLAEFDQAYDARKQERQLLRFDDVTRCIAGASRAGSSFRLDGRIRHLLLDEFQDTAPLQWRVIRPFALRALEEGSFFCVGDVKQAIYGWRGGAAEIFDALERELKVLPQSLAQSYRSSPAIMETVNHLFCGLTKHNNLGRFEPAVAGFCRVFPEHTTAREGLPGFAALHVTSVPKDPHAHYEEAVEHIARLAAEAPGRSIGVLCRKNDVVARVIYLLRKKGLAASEEGGNPLVDSAPIEAILSLLRIVDHPGNTVARFHVAHTPLGEVVGYSDWRSTDAAERLARSWRRKLLEDGYGPVILEWAKRLAKDCSERDRTRLQQMIEAAFDYQPSATLRTRDFIDQIELQKVPDPIAADIRVMTIHASKGLEFDIVVLPELNTPLGGQTPACVHGRAPAAEELVCRYMNEKLRGLLPEKFRDLFDAHSAKAAVDGLCLLYVAVTRAVHALHMIIPPSLENERTLPKTAAGLVRAAFLHCDPLPGPLSAPLFGDEQWFASLPPRERRAEPEAEELPAKITLAAPLAWRTRGWQRVAPSSLEGGGKISLASVFEPKTPDLFSRGTLFHAWFEQVKWLEDGPPSEAKLRAVARRLGAEVGAAATRIDELLPQFLQALERPNTRAALARDFYRETSHAGWELVVENEYPFARVDGDNLLQGSIDRLVLWRRGEEVIAADIVDFKTDADAGAEAALQKKTEFYRPQLQAYRESIRELFDLPPERVTARLIFIAADRVVPV